MAVMLSLCHMIAFLLVTKQQCLLISGDVELNPGPLDQEMIDAILSTVDDVTFDEDNWNDIIIDCSSLAPKWQQLSGFLGLPIKTIRAIRKSYPNDSATSWSEALMQWIMQEYNTEKYGSPSWKSLLKAVSRVDETLFDRLAKEHQLEGKQLKFNKAGHCEEKSGHEPTVSKGTKLESIVSESIERPKETAKSASNASSFPVLIKGTLLASEQIAEKPEKTGFDTDSGFEGTSIVTSSSSQKHKQVEVEIELPDHVRAEIRRRYSTMTNTYKMQCPCQLKNIASLELAEVLGCCSNGKINEMAIASKRVRLPYSRLFKGAHSRQKGSDKILITGEAGVGKTILCAMIAEDWANGKLFHEFLMVLLLPLNQRNVALAQNLIDLFKNLYHFDDKTCSALQMYLIANNKGNVLIIADGWEELCESQRQPDSFLHCLLFGDLLPSSSTTVIVTSRSASIPKQSFSRTIIVEGFNEVTVKSFVQMEFSRDPEKLKCITEQLDTNPLVNSISSIPLNLAMVCSLNRSCDDPLPDTMPVLYEKLVWNLANLKINSTRNYETTLKLTNYRDLPGELQQSWSIFCEIAFNDMCPTTSSPTKVSSSFTFELEIFGLLKSTFGEAKKLMFSFLHPTFGYYLAVLHLLMRSPNEQLEILQKMDPISPMFWRFFLSMSNSIDSGLISAAIQAFNKLHPSFNKNMCLLSFESKKEIVDQQVIKLLYTSISTIMLHSDNAYDCMAMIHVLEKVEQQCNVEINFQNCKLKAKHISRLANVLGNQSQTIQVKGLDLSNNGLHETVVSDFFSTASTAFQSLEKLFLRNCGVQAEGLRAILSALVKSSCKCLTQLDLSFNSLSMTCLECFRCNINDNNVPKMEILMLKGALAEDFDVSFLKCFATALSTKCKHLRRLDLSDNKLGTCDDPDLSAVISELMATLGTKFDLRLGDNYISEVEKNFLTIMEESIRNKGTIDHTIAHGVIVGPGRSGKNTLLKRLTGEGPPDPSKVSPSTGVLENVVKVEVKKLCSVAGAKFHLKWRKLKYDEEALELIMTTAKNYSHTSDIPRPVSIKYIYRRKSESTQEQKSPATENKSKQAASKTQELEGAVDSNMDSVQEENIKYIYEYSSNVAPVDIFKKAIKLRHMDALREHLESSWSLYLTNTGGQIEFQEHLPLLVCGPSIFFVTFPLHCDLDKPYEVRYEYPDGSVKKYPSPSTLIQEILQTLATIYSLDYVNVLIGEEEVTLKPTVFIIGTHKDYLKSETEKVARIDDELQRHIKQTSLFHQGSIQFASSFEDSSECRLLFSVNNLSKGDDDFQKIRLAVQQTVEEKYHKEFTVQCPSSWLIFSLILREKHKSCRVLRFEDCFKIAKECGISSHVELTAALSFIHSRLGLVRYFDVKELNSLVVIDPEILFERITDLIKETFVGKNANQSEIDEFCQKGIISLAVMKRISERSSEGVQLPFTWLTNVLNHLRLAALFKDRYGEKYFFPSALCHVPKAQESSIKSMFPTPAIIAFETGFCPRGLAGALIKCLMTNEMGSKKHWYLLPRKIFRNQVTFSIEAVGDITLKILPTHLEIAFDPEDYSKVEDSDNDYSKSDACAEVYTQIDKCMRIVTSLYKKCKYFWTFYCTCTECEVIQHPAVIEWHHNQPFKLRCKISHKRTHLPIGCKIWNIRKKHNRELDVEIPERHLGEIADLMTEWEGQVSDKLKLRPSDVEEIKTKYPQKLRLQKREALRIWKQRNGSKATYSRLMKIFERIDCRGYADEVGRIAQLSDSEGDDSSSSEEEMKQPQTYPPYTPLPVISQLPPTASKSDEIVICYVVTDEEDLPEGDDICREEILESHNVTKCYIPNLTTTKSNTVKEDQDQELPDEEHSSENCWNCGRRATETCSGCNKARYCGTFCRYKDWTNHMHHCASEVVEIVVGDLEEFIGEISKHIGMQWMFLARSLGFEQTDIDAIEYRDQHNLREQIFQMFHEWKRREGSEATTDRLLAAVKHTKLKELIKILKEKGFIVSSLKGSSDVASALVAGVQYPIQVTSDAQRDSPAKLKTTAKSPTAPVPFPGAQAAQGKGQEGTMPLSEQDRIRQKRLQQFASDTSDTNPTQNAIIEQTTSTSALVQSPVLSTSAAATNFTGDVPVTLESRPGFEVGDMIQVDRPDSVPWYGVIRWIGTLAGTTTLSAGLEMEFKVPGGGLGSLLGINYFNCSDGHGLFLPLSHLKRDNRFAEVDASTSETLPTTSFDQDSKSSWSASAPEDRLRNLFSGFEMQDDIDTKPPDSEEGGPKAFVLQIPADQVGLVIGTGGKNIREVERLTNTIITVDRDSSLLGEGNRRVLVIGSEENCKKALLTMLKNVERRVTIDKHFEGIKMISIPEQYVGRIIGKGGATIAAIKSISGAQYINFDNRKTGLEAMLQTERKCYIYGSEEAMEKAEKLIRLAMTGEDIVAGATFAAIFMELLKMGVQCQEETN